MFRHPAWAPPAPPLALTITNSGSSDLFVLKYNTSGTAQWLRKIGGGNSETGARISSDSSGNLYVLGTYASNPVTIFDTDNETPFVDLDITGSTDIFVVKYNNSGTPQWVRKVGGSGTDSGVGISVDSSGNAYVIGTFASTLTVFDTDNSTPFTTVATTGSNDLFILKYDTSGTPQWVRKVGGTLADAANGISADSSGNVYITGSYTSATLRIFNTDNSTNFATLGNTGTSTNDVCIVKYDTSGTPQWVRKIGGIAAETAAGISVDSSGNVYTTGTYTTNPVIIYNTDNLATFTTLARPGTTSTYIVKYDTSGTPQWARRLGGTGGDISRAISADSSGNIYVVGTYGSNPALIYDANNTTTFASLTNVGSTDVFVVKYNTSGTPQWARKIGGTSIDNVQAISVDSSGNVCVTGQYLSDILTVFGTDNTTSFVDLTNIYGLSSQDGFVVKYDTTGTPQWGRNIGNVGDEFVTGSVFDSTGNIFVVGSYTSNPLTISI